MKPQLEELWVDLVLKMKRKWDRLWSNLVAMASNLVAAMAQTAKVDEIPLVDTKLHL